MKHATALTLYELNMLVRELIEQEMDRAYWVQAELAEIRVVRGHCYIDLIEKNPLTNTPVARAQARIWANTWARLKPTFERTTGRPLAAGMKVMVKVTANFHEAYGFAWIVQDIDPTYTMGDMARKRQEIVRRLQDEGVFDLNKELTIPMFAQRIAVISSAGAAGYGDFCDQLDHNRAGIAFSHELFQAVMQGDGVEGSIIQALDAIYGRLQDFDVVVIIRGGGAVSDLSGFDSYLLALNVCNFPLPVVTGIGHERDDTVIDMVAHTRVKTPTAAAEFLTDHLSSVLNHLTEMQQRVADALGARWEKERMRLQVLSGRIPYSVMRACNMQRSYFQRVSSILSTIPAHRIEQQRHRVSLLESRLSSALTMRMEREQHRLAMTEQRLAMADPIRMLEKGYSITTVNGKTVRSCHEVRKGDVVTTRLADGTIRSKVLES